MSVPQNDLSSWLGIFNPGRRLFMLPDVNHPRFFAASESIRQRWHDSQWFPAYRPAAVALRYIRRIQAALMPATRTAPHCEPVFARTLTQSGITFARAVLWVGTHGERQKYSIRLLNNRGKVMAHAKIGFSPTARNLLRREAEILQYIPRELGPALYNVIEHPDFSGLLMEHVPGQPCPARLKRSQANYMIPAAAEKFLPLFPVQRQAMISDHPAILRLAGNLPDSLLAPLRPRTWPVILQHGDYAPWNLLADGGRIRAIDWEDAVPDGFLYFDLVHYMIQVSVLVHHWPREKIKRHVLLQLQRYGLSGMQADSILRLAAMDASRRFNADPPSSPLPGIRAYLAGTACT